MRIAVIAVLAALSFRLTAADESSGWQEKLQKGLKQKTTFEFVDAPLEEAINFIATQTKINIILNPAVLANGNNPTCSFRVRDVSVEEALQKVTKDANLQTQIIDEALFIQPAGKMASDVCLQALDSEIDRKLRRKVSFEFADTPAGEGFNFMRQLCHVPLVLDSRLDQEHPVTLRVTNMTCRSALCWIARLGNAEWTAVRGVIFVFPKDAYHLGIPKPLTEAQADNITRAIAALANDDFDTRQNAAKTIEQAGSDAGPLLKSALATQKDPEVVYQIKRILAGFGRTEFFDESVELARFLDSHANEMTADWVEFDAAQAYDAVAKAAGIKIVAAKGLNPVSFHADKMKAGEVLRWMTLLAGASLQLNDGVLYVVK